jgi:membrane protein
MFTLPTATDDAAEPAPAASAELAHAETSPNVVPVSPAPGGPFPAGSGDEALAADPAATVPPAPALLRWLVIAREVTGATLAKAWKDRILGLSAEAAFWQLLSLPPLLLGMLGTLGYVGDWIGPNVIERIERHLLLLSAQVLQPAMVDQIVQPVLSQVLTHGRGGVATVSFVIALWAGSSATSTFVNTITIAYGQRDLRGAVRSRLLALWLYVCALAVGTVAAPLLVLGPGALVRALPEQWRGAASVVVHVTYWPLLGGLVFVALSAFYHLSTPVRLRWRRAVPGAALALALFLLLAYLLQLYIDAVANRLLVFSTLAAPILALFYFYVLALAVLLGAELNATLERRWPRGSKPRPIEVIRGLHGRVIANSTLPRLPRRSAEQATAEPPDALAHSPAGSES